MEFVYLIILLIGCGHTVAYTRTTEMCRYYYFSFKCNTCYTNIICHSGTQIRITTVEYRESSLFCISGKYGGCCYMDLHISTEHKESINEFCNDQDVCNLASWKPNTGLKMRITYVCEYSTPAPGTTTTTVVSTSTTQTTPIHKTTTKRTVSSTSEQVKISPKLSTDSIRTDNMNHEDNNSGSFPLAASISIPTGVVVVILIIAGIVWGVRRRFLNNTLRFNEGNYMRMQDVMNQSIEKGSDSVGHSEDLDIHTETCLY